MKNYKFLLLPLFIFSLIALLVLAFGFSLKLASPDIEKEIREGLMQECSTCEFSMRETQIIWRGLSISDVKVSGGYKGGQFIEMTAASMVVRPSLTGFFSKKNKIDSILILNPIVTFHDGDKPPPPQKTAKTNNGNEAATVQWRRLFVQNGKFNYIRDTKGTHAELKILNIDAEMDPSPNLMRARMTAQIGNSGSVQLIVESPIQKKPLSVDVIWKVRNQNFAPLSQFFKPNAGVELNGILVRGDARTQMRGKKLTATLTAEYKDFSLKVHELYDRNELQAFFTNLGASIAIQNENLEKSRSQKSKTVELERESDESIVSFILRGLKESALAIAI